ncbi:MAG TPA: DUF4190 domain-containing protein [Holophaga sp.]|nr:DUF4190 domain-containing protein [Holophaga sp.]HPS66346.1 DUF4190 domain-containing protein [Holophaga sp.]
MNQIDQVTSLKPHRGGMLLAFGILGLLCCIVFGILAWVMGNSDLKEMAEGRMDPEGEGMTKAGKILGIIGCVLNLLGILAGIAVFVFGIAIAGLQGAMS